MNINNFQLLLSCCLNEGDSLSMIEGVKEKTITTKHSITLVKNGKVDMIMDHDHKYRNQCNGNLQQGREIGSTLNI